MLVGDIYGGMDYSKVSLILNSFLLLQQYVTCTTAICIGDW